MKHPDAKKTLLDKPWFAIVVFLILAVLVVGTWWYLPDYLTRELTNPADKGVLGDSYGSVNALFTGLAFSGLVFTILLQLREIRLQRADFLSQLEALQTSHEEVARQNQLLRSQMEIQLLDVRAKAAEIDTRALELQAEGWTPGTNQHSRYVTQIQTKAKDLRAKLSEIVLPKMPDA